MKLVSIGNILIIVCSGLITVLSVMMLIVMIGLAPNLLAELEMQYIIPFALALMMPVINLFFAETFTIVGVMGVNTPRYKLIDRVGLGLVVIYIIIISIWLTQVLQAFANVSAPSDQISPFIIIIAISILLSVLTLVGLIIRLLKR